MPNQPYIPTNLHRGIRAHTVALSFQRNGEQQIGSGVLVKIADRIFVLTAGHVAGEQVSVGLGLYTPLTPFTILQRGVDESDDIGYLELKPFEVEILRRDEARPYAIAAKQEAAIPTKKPTLAICGFPTALAQPAKQGVAVPIMFQTVAMLDYSGWPSVYKNHLNPKRHFVLIYGPKRGGTFTYRDNAEPSDPIPPYGFSGTGLWLFDPLTENDDNPAYALVGIQHSYDEFYQILYGTFAEILIDKILQELSIQLSDNAP